MSAMHLLKLNVDIGAATPIETPWKGWIVVRIRLADAATGVHGFNSMPSPLSLMCTFGYPVSARTGSVAR